jgi:hypothetical protein
LGSVPQSYVIVTYQIGTKFCKKVFECLAFLFQDTYRQKKSEVSV